MIRSTWLRRVAALAGLGLAAACSDSVTQPASPADVRAVEGTVTQTGTAATVVAISPAVVVVDENGSGVAGVSVNFTVTAGGGLIVGGTEKTTDRSGRAAIAYWVLGASGGENTLTATVAGLPPVTFTAVAKAGTAAVIKQDGDAQRAVAGSTLPQPLVVRLVDADGNAVADQRVAFKVTAGGGKVTASQLDSTVVRTDSLGTARVTFTLGARAGTNTVTAGAVGAPTATFTAEGFNPCSVSTPHGVGTTADGALRALDCRFNSGEYVDFYALDSADHRVLTVEQTSDSLDAFVILYNAAGTIVAYGDGSARNASLVALVAPGSYFVGASAHAGEVGPYRLATQAAPALEVASCAPVFVTRGVTTSQQVQTTDCAADVPNASTGAASRYYFDRFLVYLRAGEPLTLDMTDPALDAYLEVYDAAGRLVAAADGGGAAGTKDAHVTFTAPYGGFFAIWAGTSGPEATGSYGLAVR